MRRIALIAIAALVTCVSLFAVDTVPRLPDEKANFMGSGNQWHIKVKQGQNGLHQRWYTWNGTNVLNFNGKTVTFLIGESQQDPDMASITGSATSTYVWVEFTSNFLSGPVDAWYSTLKITDPSDPTFQVSQPKGLITIENAPEIDGGDVDTARNTDWQNRLYRHGGSGPAIGDGSTITWATNASGQIVMTSVGGGSATNVALADLVGTMSNNYFAVGDGTNLVLEAPADARTSLGLGSASTNATEDFATAAQGSASTNAQARVAIIEAWQTNAAAGTTNAILPDGSLVDVAALLGDSYSGTVTRIIINNTTNDPVDGVVDLGDIAGGSTTDTVARAIATAGSNEAFRVSGETNALYVAATNDAVIEATNLVAGVGYLLAETDDQTLQEVLTEGHDAGGLPATNFSYLSAGMTIVSNGAIFYDGDKLIDFVSLILGGAAWSGNGGGFTNLDWDNINQNMPAGFGDGTDDDTTEHDVLTSLGWAVSGHTGTPSRLAGFGAGGAAEYVDYSGWETGSHSTFLTNNQPDSVSGAMILADLDITNIIRAAQTNVVPGISASTATGIAETVVGIYTGTIDTAVQPSDTVSIANTGTLDGYEGADLLGFTNRFIAVAASDETTDLTTGAGKATFRMPYAMDFDEVRISATTAPVGSTLVVDINTNGSSILSTKLSIDTNELTSVTAATAAVLSATNIADDVEVTIDIDQIGASTAGAGLKVYMIEN